MTPTAAPSRPLILLMALACGVAVGNLYFPQAVTPLLAADFHVSGAAAAVVATLGQFGYAAGIFFVLPLGDRVSRRPLITVLFTLVTIGLVVAGTAQALPLLYVVSVLIGIVTVVPQVLIPMSADLAPAGRAGRVTAVLASGLVGGILLARAFGGVLGEWNGWRAPYLVAAVLSAVMTVALAVAVPATAPAVRHRYPALLATSLRLFREQAGLRRSCLYQAAMFAAFSAAWTTVALYLTGPHFGYGTGVVGAVALVGAASVVIVPFAGRVIDRVGPDAINGACFAGGVLSAAVLLGGLLHGVPGLVLLAAGLLLLDVCVQASQIANQNRIFALVPGARSRLNSVYMTSVFLGGSVGSALGTLAYEHSGWTAVCGFVALGAVLAGARHVAHRVRLAQEATRRPSPADGLGEPQFGAQFGGRAR